MLAANKTSRLARLWYGQGDLPEKILWCSLVPLSLIYRGVISCRNAWWRANIFRKRAEKIKVVSVGNITVGGNGKTPFTVYLANLLAQHGIRTAVVGRGYPVLRRATVKLVADKGKLVAGPNEVGDEAVMIARSFSAGPVMVAKRRYDAIRTLEDSGEIEAVILDDAFQHVGLARDLNLVLIKDDLWFGNGWLLPAGPLREPAKALRRASAIVVINSSAQQRPSPVKLESVAAEAPILRAELKAKAIVIPRAGRWEELPLEAIAGRRVVAVSGIANPGSFYETLRSLDVEMVDTLEYPDHYFYRWSDWQKIMRVARAADFVVTTEKDMVKLESFPFPRDSLCAIRIGVEMENPDDLLRLLSRKLGLNGI